MQLIVRKLFETSVLFAVIGCASLPNPARAISIDLGTASVPMGRTGMLPVTLHTMGTAVVGAVNRIDFSRATPIAAGEDGTPDCVVNPRIQKGATAFAFLPVGCDPAVDCESVRVLVVSFTNVNPIADGSLLYSCRIAVPSDTPLGIYPLHNREASASGLNHVTLPASGSDGSVAVTPPPALAVDIGTITAPAATTASFPVTLRLISNPVPDVIAVQIDVSFDARTPVVATADGTPVCTAPTEIGKPSSTFRYLPLGCTPGIDCTGVRAIVFSIATTFPLAEGVTLYTCAVAPPRNTPPGSYPLVASGTEASDPLGEPVPVDATNGAIAVTPALCVGDCNGDQRVSIDELLIGVNILTQSAASADCSRADANQDGQVTVDELIQAVDAALNGCPQ
jgi:hypothetical protein